MRKIIIKNICVWNVHVRDRPFNLQGGGGGGGYGFLFRSEIFFSDNTGVRIFILFFQNFTLGYMTKPLNQIKKNFLHQNQNIFFSNIGNQNISFRKTPLPPPPPPPPEVKWSVPNTSQLVHVVHQIVYQLVRKDMVVNEHETTQHNRYYTWT